MIDYSRVNIDVDTNPRLYAQSSDISAVMNNIDKKVMYLIFPMGGNKTGAVADFLVKDHSSCIFLNCRRSLAQNLQGRLPKRFIHYEDKDSLNKIRAASMEISSKDKLSIIKTQAIPKCDWLITTPNSVHYTIGRQYDIVVIDEFELFQTSWLDTKTHTSLDGCKYTENWTTFKSIITNAKKIILMDALPSLNTILFMSRLGITRDKIEVIGTTAKRDFGKVVFINREKGSLENVAQKLIKIMVNKLKDGKRIYIFWPYKTPKEKKHGETEQKWNRLSCSELANILIQHVTKRKLKYLMYTSDTMKESVVRNSLIDVNQSWSQCDFVIVNQCITVGVNFDIPEIFDSVFIATTSFVSPRETTQTSCRIRKTAAKTIYCALIGGRNPSSFNFGDLPDDDTIRANARDLFNEKMANNEICIKHMFQMAGMNVDVPPEKLVKLPRLFKTRIQPDDRYSWSAIPDIDDPDVYERLCLHGAECTEDILRLFKYNFRQIFDENVPEYLISDLWTSRNIVLLIKRFVDNENSWLDQLFTELKIEKATFDLPSQFKISAMLKEKLLATHVFYRLDIKKSTDMNIVSTCLRSFFGTSVFDYNHGTQKYELNENFHTIYLTYQQWKFQAQHQGHVGYCLLGMLDEDMLDEEPSQGAESDHESHLI